MWGGTAAAQSTPFGDRGQQKGFARVLDVEGELVFAGEPKSAHTPGRVYVFNQKTDSTWAEATYLEAQDGAVGDQFGAALDAQGDRLLVGAPAANAAYLLQQSKNGWTQVARLTSPDSTVGFGRSVALTDTHLVVGSQTTVSTTETDTTAAAAVHVFERRSDTGWTESIVLRSSQLAEGAGFGDAVATQGDHLLVAAPRRDGGAVVAFRRDSTWSEVQTLSAGELSSSAQLGAALAWAGDGRIVIGAPRAHDAAGVAYTFRYSASAKAWQRDGRLFPFDGASRQYFGAALAHDGTDVWVGAPGLQNQRGALYRFMWRDSSWADVNRIQYDRKGTGGDWEPRWQRAIRWSRRVCRATTTSRVRWPSIRSPQTIGRATAPLRPPWGQYSVRSRGSDDRAPTEPSGRFPATGSTSRPFCPSGPLGESGASI